MQGPPGFNSPVYYRVSPPIPVNPRTDWSVGYKRARFDEPPTEQSFFDAKDAKDEFDQDTGEKRTTREGPKPFYKFFRWTDSDGNGSVKNIVNFGWTLNPSIQGYKKAGVVSVNMTNLYNAAHLFNYLGIKIENVNPCVSSTSNEVGQTQVNPTFLVPNLVWLQGAQNPIAATTSNVVYFDPSGECISADFRGPNISQIKVSLTDETMDPLVPASTSGYNFYMLLKFY
jgi:hypothetical protein